MTASSFFQKALEALKAKRELTQSNYEKIQRHPFMRYESDPEPLMKALANYGQIEIDGMKKVDSLIFKIFKNINFYKKIF